MRQLKRSVGSRSVMQTKHQMLELKKALEGASLITRPSFGGKYLEMLVQPCDHLAAGIGS